MKSIAQRTARLGPHLKPPGSLIGRVRWIFLLVGLLAAGITIPLVVASSRPLPLRVAALAGILWLCWSWVRVYGRQRSSTAWTATEGLALIAIGLGAFETFAVLGVLYNGLVFRALYGTSGRVIRVVVIYVGSLLGAVGLSVALLGASVPLGELLIHMVGLAMLAVVFHILAVTLAKSERTLDREKILRKAGATLAGSRDRVAIYTTAVNAALELVGEDQGTRTGLAVGPPEKMAIVAAAGERASELVGKRLDVHLLPEHHRDRFLAKRPVEAGHVESVELRRILGMTPVSRPFFLVPLFIEDDLSGALVAAGGSAFSQEVKDGLEALGSQVSLALESVAFAEDRHWRQSEVRFRALIQNSSDLVMVLGADDTISYVSPSVQRMVGYSPRDLIGKDAFEGFVHPDDIARVKASHEQVKETRHAMSVLEVRLRHRDGFWRYLEVARNNLLDDPDVQGVVINARDVTERRRSEEALRKSEALNRAIVDTASDAIVTTTASGLVRSFNRSAERIFGYAAEEVVGKPLEMLMPERFQGSHGVNFRRYLETGETRIIGGPPVELAGLRKSGEEFPLELSLGETREGDDVLLVGVIRDITERKRADVALRKRERELVAAQRIASVGNWGFDVVENRAHWSDEMYRIFGLAPGRGLTYRGFLSLVHPDDRGLVGEAAREALEGGERSSIDYRVVRPNGEVRFVHAQYEVQSDASGRITDLVGTLQDITELRRTEEESRARAEKLREQAKILDLAPVLIRNLEDEILLWNIGAEKLYGFNKDEAVGRVTHELLRSEHPEPVEEIKREILQQGRWEGEIVHVRNDGERVVVASLQVLHRDEHGNPAAILEVNNDITEKRRAEESLRRSEEQYRNLFENNPHPMWVYEEGTYAILAVNDSAVEHYGYSREEFLSMTIKDLRPPEDVPVLVADVEKIRQELRYSGEWRHRKKDGTVIDVEITSHSLVFFGKAGRLVRANDITERKRAERALQEAEAKYRTLIEQIPVATYIQEIEHRNATVYMSPQIEDILGYSSREYIEDPSLWLDVLHPEDRERVLAEDERTDASGEPFRMEYRMIRRDGRVVWVQDEALIVRDTAGRPLYWRGVMLDVTERKQAEQELRRSEERFRSLVQNSLDVITVIDAEATIVYNSPSVQTVTGYDPEELVGKSALGAVPIHPDDLPQVREILGYLVQNPGANHAMEMRLRHADGCWRAIEATANNLLEDPSVGGIVVNYRDITERKAFEEQLRHQALHDDLTGLPNRTLLMNRLEHALARAERYQSVAVLFLDLDNFKVVNDSLGHQVGDELLVIVAGRLREGLRSADTVARLGGDKFIVLLEDVGEDGEAARLAGRLAECLRAPLELGGQEVHLTASIGIAFGSSRDERPEDLLRNANLAMYRAKSGGKAGYMVFDVTMGAEARERLSLESDLRHAIERDELEVHYQPKVRLETGEVIGFEALARWNHSRRGMVSPTKFIPLAEETGLIHRLGGWVLREACRQAREWHKKDPNGTPMEMCVNLSARQLQHPDLLHDVGRILRETGMDGSLLCLEITESVAMENVQPNIATLNELKNGGIKLSIDDFGTGYSSLSHLNRLPVNYLKIDRSFVTGLGDDSEAEAIVQGTIRLAHALSVEVIAEGVETAAQLGRLREMGCDVAQGYYFSKPLTATEISGRFLATHAVNKVLRTDGEDPLLPRA